MSDISQLKIELDKIKTYPALMEKVMIGISGLAFFPGGRGLLEEEDETISDKPVMVLGQDFDTKAKYLMAKKNGEEDLLKNKTWSNLKALLEKSNVPLTDCFFTNVIMGVRLTEVATGKSPAFKDPDFLTACQNFFLYQLSIQKPKVVLVLGMQVAECIAPLCNPVLSAWTNIPNFTFIDASMHQIKRDVTFSNGITTTLVLLMHPSARLFNLHARRYGSSRGLEAQVEMIEDAFNF